MKNVVIGFCSILILILTGLTIGTVQGKTMRQNELDTTVSSSMEQSMRILTLDQKYKMENEDEFISDFIQSALMGMDSKSHYEIVIHTVDVQKGLLDVSVTEHYKQAFVPGKVTCRESIVLDDYNKEDVFTVSFKKGDKVIKMVNISGGNFLSAGILPQNVKVTQWKLEQNGNIYTAENISDVAVTQDITFIAQKENNV